nr:diguanylate cyclase [uncultured Cohaesibacter sp.]
MYHRDLNILIVAQSSELEAVLEKLPAEPNFTNHLCCSQSIDWSSVALYSLIIVDFEVVTTAQLARLSDLKNRKAAVIGCFAEGDFPLLTQTHHLLAQVWTKPFDLDKIRPSFCAMLKQFRDREDARLTEGYLDSLIDGLPELIWFKDARGSHLKVNESFSKTVNKSKSQIEGRGHYYIWDLEPDEYAQGEYICLESEEIVLARKETCLFDETVKCGDELRKFKTHKSPIFDEDGSVIGTVGFAHDVTDQQNLMVELDILVEGLPFAVMVTDTEKVITNVNQKFVDIFILDRSEFIGQCADAFMDESGKFSRTRKWAFSEEDGKVLMQSHNQVLELHDEKLLDVFGTFTGHIYLFEDITHEYNIKKKLLTDANTDYLTKLNNRRCLKEFLSKRPLGSDTVLMLIDLDNFKEINDRFGHDQGDRVLVAFAALLRATFSEERLFRLGGDEFAILLPSYENSDHYAVLLQQQFEAYIARHFPRSNVSASFGVATGSDADQSFSKLFKRADIALYEFKRRKKLAA